MLICRVFTLSKPLRRHLCSRVKPEQEKKPKNIYSHTVNLPSTQFPLWVKPQDRAKLDQKIHKESGFSELYVWQREALKDNEEFVLHDGPPYANGSPHIGHAVNKILKDITIRYNLLEGKRIHYVPGWDCHGLPIELKAITSKDKKLSTLEIREKARSFASETIRSQKAEFESWGVLADWKNNCYHTFDANYVKNQLHQFYNLYRKDYIYRDLKPVYWSPSSRTALAESELEYKPDHISKSVYLKIKLTQVPDQLAQHASNLHALIWTTTPWSLPSNQFIAFSPTLEYSVVSFSGVNVIVANCLVESLKEIVESDVTVLCNFPGHYLHGVTYTHPVNKDCQDLKLLPADFVSASKGTGLVHCAPAHGQDDFVTALAHKIPVLNLINDLGRYSSSAGAELAGLNVLSEGQDRVLDKVRKDILWTGDYEHSYPYDWRTKKPVILKASQQWFIDTERIKYKALDCLKSVNFIPKSGRNALEDILEQRPYWCISRQRVWGVPIPVFYDGGSIVVSEGNIKHFCRLIDEHGTDFWWSLPDQQLLNTCNDCDHLVKSSDILDIWFDSGVSWSHVLRHRPADVYLEGVDQTNGWFIASLLTSVALNQSAPFRNIFLHGFVVDEKGLKMSKSVGNVISAHDVIQGAKKLPAYGADVLRWWVAAHASKDVTVRISRRILDASQEDVQKVRSALRYLVGVLARYEPPATPPRLRHFDTFVLKSLADFQTNVDTLYARFEFARATRLVLHFVTNSLSALCFGVLKDRLYCDPAQGEARLAALFTLDAVLHVLLRGVAPILPHLAEEVFTYVARPQDSHFFHSSKRDISRYQSEDTRAVETALSIRNKVNSSLPENVNRLRLHVRIEASDQTYSRIQPLLKFPAASCSADSELCEILQVASVDVARSAALVGDEFTAAATLGEGGQCARCRRFVVFRPAEELCTRCRAVIGSN